MLALIIQVLRRLRNSTRIVDRLADHTAASPDAKPTDVLRISKSLTRFISRQEFRFGLLTSNLRLDSPHFRYALRVTAAAALAMTLASRWLSPAFSAHNYWIMLTIVIIMKPGFALTRQRNGWRLTGTVIGCVCALLLFNLTDSPEILFAVLLAACIMGNSLVQLNYMASAIFNTLFVVLVFHFVSPGTVSMSVIGERAIDTLIGCALALVCSYILPWWEARYLKPLAAAATRANREYLLAGMRYADAMQAPADPAPDAARDGQAPAIADADRLAAGAQERAHRLQQFRRGVLPHDERTQVASGQRARAEQPADPEPCAGLADHGRHPDPGGAAANARAGARGAGRHGPAAGRKPDAGPAPVLPTQFDTDGEQAALAYPLKQMIKASHMIRQELLALDEPAHAPGAAAPA